MRSTVAPATPQKMILVRFSLGRPATAIPMMMALSPDITRSISTTCNSATAAPCPIIKLSNIRDPAVRSGLRGLLFRSSRQVEADHQHQPGAERRTGDLRVGNRCFEPRRGRSGQHLLDQVALAVGFVET